MALSNSSFFIIHHELSLLGFLLTVQASTWITSGLIRLFFLDYSSWTKTSKASFYRSDLSFYIKCDGARQVTIINVEVVVEPLVNFRKLPWRSLPSLGSTSISQICLRRDLSTKLERSLSLTNDLRTYVHY